MTTSTFGALLESIWEVHAHPALNPSDADQIVVMERGGVDRQEQACRLPISAALTFIFTPGLQILPKSPQYTRRAPKSRCQVLDIYKGYLPHGRPASR
jgi:hypothetical protein